MRSHTLPRMGIGNTLIRTSLLAVSCTSLSACGAELFGYPGSDRPDAANQTLSANAVELVRTATQDLPTPAIDIAAWPAPSMTDRLPGIVAEAAIADAAGHSAAYSLLRAQRAIVYPVHAHVDFDAPWPDAAPWTAIALDEARPDVWLDASEPGGPWQQALDALEPDVRVVLTHCDAGGEASTRACLTALRGRTNTLLALGGYTQRHAVPVGLMLILQQTSLHTRYRWSSAWPAPAVNWLVWLQPLAKHGFINAGHVAPLREIYADNPLLFDLVLWRLVRLPDTDIALPAEVFGGLPEADTD